MSKHKSMLLLAALMNPELPILLACEQVSPSLTRMLELVHRLLCPDYVLLTVIGPPDRSFVRDAAGIRPGV